MSSDTTSPGSGSPFTAELFVRSLAPQGAHGCQQAVIDRLDRLQQDGQIESITCTVWGNRICPETASRIDDGQNALRDIARLRRWTSNHSVSLSPFFEERRIEPIEEEPYTVIVPPILCLAISRDEELWGVFPCVKDGQSLSAMDGLDALAEETPPEPYADRTPLQP